MLRKRKSRRSVPLRYFFFPHIAQLYNSPLSGCFGMPFQSELNMNFMGMIYAHVLVIVHWADSSNHVKLSVCVDPWI